MKEGLHVFRKARTAVPWSSIKKALADPGVAADAQADGMDVSPRRVAEARELVHERDAHREHGVRGVLRELARPRIGDDDALSRELQRRVEGAKGLARLFAARAQDDPIGAEEVLNRRPFFQKFGIRYALEGHASRRDARLDGVARSHGDGALVGDERRPFRAVCAIRSATARTGLMSAAPSGPGGVPTATK